MPNSSITSALLGQGNALVDEFAEVIVVEGGRRDGSDETRVTVDVRYPGVVLDAAIVLDKTELADLGFRRGKQRGGYSGEYYELVA